MIAIGGSLIVIVFGFNFAHAETPLPLPIPDLCIDSIGWLPDVSGQ